MLVDVLVEVGSSVPQAESAGVAVQEWPVDVVEDVPEYVLSVLNTELWMAGSGAAGNGGICCGGAAAGAVMNGSARYPAATNCDWAGAGAGCKLSDGFAAVGPSSYSSVSAAILPKCFLDPAWLSSEDA